LGSPGLQEFRWISDCRRAPQECKRAENKSGLERRFHDLPVLVDALQVAGCTDADILDHCRQPGEHIRGCWVVDLLLSRG
jgi:hypothetical protein